MSDFRGNIEHWIRQSEPDYYILFLKAWIPFNAWYVAELPHLNKKDSALIKELQDNINSKPRKIIENFLTNRNDYEALSFRSYLAELHFFLDNVPLTHSGARLTFKRLALTENPEKFKTSVDPVGNLYKAERTSTFFQAFIEEKGGKILLDAKFPTYNIEDLKKDNDYIRLKSPDFQSQILEHFADIDPKKPICLISSSNVTSEFIELKSKNSCNFINDPTTVAKGCIKILYALRCMLFHGEVEPNITNRPIYENAFFLLRLIINKLQ
jgi:hypothetical protein